MKQKTGEVGKCLIQLFVADETRRLMVQRLESDSAIARATLNEKLVD